MQSWIRQAGKTTRWAVLTWGLTLCGLWPLAVMAQGRPAQEVFLPKSGQGPVVVVVSGQSGPPNYRAYARQVAELGYRAVLIDGRDILTRQQDGAQNLRAVITTALDSTNGASSKVMLIGFSQGGGGVLAHGLAMSELVKAAVLHYPATSWAKNLGGVVGRIHIPVLVLAAELDRYQNCCLIEHMREIESLAKARQIPLQLVVYPNADHGFNLDGRNHRVEDAADAWRRMVDMLSRHHPVR
ncbi:dienelactone hydrolase family protein [Accumulibacter sp.]|uniref:dienelactone hydrolase family protein n=1 Tax=Accumulibacter sp. TaxID=2053492 RepID=UPI0025EE6621|nr:dienelactone hydrolase family protein [Accumulibacter sp.]MCM8612771.1 dienelactone hydrolase family protein [Accumulibacter sp.]MCM8637579.1 dienelactone hydrolase family protein [Accumulibacter sp.]MCM8639704.1 dienelactone hydrolase family protein [Accumulibacter sp.]